MKKGFPVVYYLVLKKNYMMPRGLTLIAIGYKYNARKDLSFIATEYTGGAQYIITYLSNYSDLFYNDYIHPTVHPRSVSKFLASVNEVDSQKNPDSLIQYCKITGFISVVGYGYVVQFLWGLILLISGNYFFMELIEINMKN